MVERFYILLLDAFIPSTMESILSFVNATEPTHNMSIILTRLLDLLQFAAHSNDCVGRPNASNIIDPTSCNHFIMCTNTRSVRKRCPDNLLYDPEKDACEFADKVKCVNGMRPTPVTTKSNVFNNATTISPHSTVLINTTTVTVEIPPNICNRLETGQDVVDPKSCTHFYICVHTRPVRKTCPPTLVYNREARVCDFPKNVQCKNGKRPQLHLRLLHHLLHLLQFNQLSLQSTFLQYVRMQQTTRAVQVLAILVLCLTLGLASYSSDVWMEQ